MKSLLRSEEMILFLFGVFLFAQLSYSWWWFIFLLLLPDVGMLGYVANKRVGALTYNLFHHRGLAILLYLLGWYLSVPLLQLFGTILFAHVALDRAFGYGFKYNRGFRHTHQGEIGKKHE